MLIAGAVCPHPPLLIPATLGAGRDDPPPALRKMADATALAVGGLLAACPDLLAVVGGGPADHEYGPHAAGSLHEFGVDVTVGMGEPVLPLSLTVGRWLLECAGVLGPTATTGQTAQAAGRAALAVIFQAVDSHATAANCLKLGADLAGRAPRVAVLAMGDGCARPACGDPGTPDPQAQEYDEDVAEALAAADARWLGRLAPALAGKLMVAGRAAWQVLAGAAGRSRLHGRLLYMAAPYGVTYLVASWEEPKAD